MSFVSDLEAYVTRAIHSRTQLKDLWLRECVRAVHLANVHRRFDEVLADMSLEEIEGEQTWFAKYRGQRIAKMTLPKESLK